MSLADVDETTMAEIAGVCHLPTTQIEDVYACAPLQMEMIAGTRGEVFHIILSIDSGADVNRFCEALRKVVSLNAVLRTRFVDCHLGILQVVVSEDHVTERLSGGVEQYLRNEDTHCQALGMPVFRSAIVHGKFVASIDHSIADYWSLTTFLTEDLAVAYGGNMPTPHSPFKEFVEHCICIDESTAKSFWVSRFKGVPAIFPKAKPGYTPHGRRRDSRKIDLKRIDNGVSKANIPSFIEAAWALTASIYADSESVAFGTVLSGRYLTLNGAETTLGPTIAEVPVQVNLQRNMTVEGLVKDRATSLRQLQTNPALQYGIKRIGALSDAARIASGFQTLLNIRGSAAKVIETGDKSFEMIWPPGPFAIDLICSLLKDGVLIETRFDPEVLCERQMHRVLNQFEHTLRLLTEVHLETKLDKLQLLNRHDRSEILKWNENASERIVHRGNCCSGGKGTPIGTWIVNPQNPSELTPIGGVGELLVEVPDSARSHSDNESKTATSFIPPPPWASSCGREGTYFHRTGDLVKYSPDGDVSFIGRQKNRVKLGSHKVQLEEVESILAKCGEVGDIVTPTKIFAGRTQLVAVVCLNDSRLPQKAVLQRLPESEIVDQSLNAVRTFARSTLPPEEIPTVWLAVEKLPRMASGKLDRAATREWLKTVKI